MLLLLLLPACRSGQSLSPQSNSLTSLATNKRIPDAKFRSFSYDEDDEPPQPDGGEGNFLPPPSCSLAADHFLNLVTVPLKGFAAAFGGVIPVGSCATASSRELIERPLSRGSGGRGKAAAAKCTRLSALPRGPRIAGGDCCRDGPARSRKSHQQSSRARNRVCSVAAGQFAMLCNCSPRARGKIRARVPVCLRVWSPHNTRRPQEPTQHCCVHRAA